MANFCRKCGASVSPTSRFCTACGAPTGAEAEPSESAPPATTPAVAQPSCAHCGAPRIDPSARFCTGCGKAITEPQPSATPVDPVEAPASEAPDNRDQAPQTPATPVAAEAPAAAAPASTPAVAESSCAHCGAGIDPSARFCTACGKAVTEPQPSATPVDPVEAPASEAAEAPGTQPQPPAISVEPVKPAATETWAAAAGGGEVRGGSRRGALVAVLAAAFALAAAGGGAWWWESAHRANTAASSAAASAPRSAERTPAASGPAAKASTVPSSVAAEASAPRLPIVAAPEPAAASSQSKHVANVKPVAKAPRPLKRREETRRVIRRHGDRGLPASAQPEQFAPQVSPVEPAQAVAPAAAQPQASAAKPGPTLSAGGDAARIARLGAALQQCASESFLERQICEQKTRWTYCGVPFSSHALWGKTPECPESASKQANAP